nr:sulfur carrier protein ThiS [Pantoea multigeneris]
MNGQPVETGAMTLAALLLEQNIDASCVASAVNGEFVPRSRYADFALAEGQQLEVLSPMQGG